jgi:murein DD-endopeptidase MepM/ murein hydrolase activator NlpD
MNKSQWMAKRLEAKYAIDGTGAYAKSNLQKFKKNSNLDVDSLAPEDKAKLAYLLHHEGDFGTRRLLGISGSRTSEEWTDALGRQLGTNAKDPKARENAEARKKSYLTQYGGNGHLAYKGWFFSLVDSKINVNHFVVSSADSFAKKPRSIAEITESLTKTPQATTPQPKSKAPSVPQTPPAPPPQQVQTAQQDGWHDPLSVCTLRTAGLASKVGSTFGMTRQSGTKPHQGLDFVATPGTPIYAVADGEVVPLPDPSIKSYGDVALLVVNINDLPEKQAQLVRNAGKTQGSIGFAYAHLSELPKKRFVQAGEIIGKTGCTGNANTMPTVEKGAHLHFEIRVDPYKAPKGLANRIDPLPFINNCTNK